MRWLILALLLIPAAEIGVFIWLGSMIGPWWVVFFILFTGIAGVAIAKRQGTDTWNRARLMISQGQPPGEAMIDGICIFIGSILLFSPGFISDILGIVLVLPFTRRPIKWWVYHFLKRKIENGTIIHRKW
ncbi:FxsA family protein [Oceanobacillus chungangensis]|uniref:Membrane protein FxsA n=1 Tax=Oceanobacillus chungangensis TaxID=1229152 RepID=A0A3D8Q358_9BACI|nr:FxsA family protein [Oceanobacillus chungangensis]RDW21585.1 membrane protein FxsA [Oceanobacillus chungangensis]